MTASTINSSTITLMDGSATVAASVAYNAATNTATVTPSSALVQLEDLHPGGQGWRKRREGPGRQCLGRQRDRIVHHRGAGGRHHAADRHGD